MNTLLRPPCVPAWPFPQSEVVFLPPTERATGSCRYDIAPSPPPPFHARPVVGTASGSVVDDVHCVGTTQVYEESPSRISPHHSGSCTVLPLDAGQFRARPPR
jgi:hypothetical protein